MSPRIQPLAVLVATSLVAVAACGDDSNDESGETAEPAITTDQSSDPSPTTAPTTASHEPERASAPETSVATSVDDEATPTTAPSDELATCTSDERIVAVDTSTMAYLMDLGLVPVGAAAYEAGFHGPDAPGDGRFAPALADLGPVEDVVPFDRFEPNIEQIAALEPTLVIGASQFFEYVPAFENVAEGVRVERYDEFENPADNLLAVAELVGCSDVGESLVTELNARIDVLTLDRADELSVDVTRWYDESVDIYLGGLVVEQLEDVGAIVPLTATHEPDEGDNRLREVSYERLDLLTADVMVRLVVPGGEFDEATLAALTDDPLYQLIPAVASDQVVDVDSFAGQGYAGMNALADELERLVAELNTIAG